MKLTFYLAAAPLGGVDGGKLREVLKRDSFGITVVV